MTGLVVAAALFAPWLAPEDPTEPVLRERLEGPSREALLGRDELGRDVLSRLVFGSRVSMIVGVSVVFFGSLLGTAVGLVSGYRGGWTDEISMRLTDVVFAFPGILLAIALVAVLGPALPHLILALVAIGWVGYARLVRGQVLKLEREDWVTAARAAGVPARRILWRHLLPGVLPVLVVQATLGMAGAILAEAGLSFLGLGVQPPRASWGAMIDAGRGHLLDAPHVALFPGLAIVWTVMGLNLLGDGLLDVMSSGPREEATPVKPSLKGD